MTIKELMTELAKYQPNLDVVIKHKEMVNGEEYDSFNDNIIIEPSGSNLLMADTLSGKMNPFVVLSLKDE